MDNKTTVISVLTIFGLIVLLFVLGNPTNVPKNKKIESSENYNTISSLAVSEKFYDFGTISMKNGNVSKVFKVTNNTDEDFFFSSLTTSCMCTKAYFMGFDGDRRGPFGMPGMGFVPKLNKTIKAGESIDIEAVYDPNAHGPAGVGRIDRFVYLEDANGNKLQFEIKANVTP